MLAVLAPFVWLLRMSIKTREAIFTFPPRLAFRPTFEHYAALWNTAFRRSFANSFAVSVVSTVLAMLLGVPGAYALSRARFHGAGHLNLWILASRMAPPIAFTIPYFLVYRHIGLLDTRTGLVIVYLTFNLSLVVWLTPCCPRLGRQPVPSTGQPAVLASRSMPSTVCVLVPVALRSGPIMFPG